MPSVCVVPKCDSKTERKSVSCFHVPQDDKIRQKWQQAIPGVLRLRSAMSVCELHFKEEEIIRKVQTYNQEDNIIYEKNLIKPRLRLGAVPSIFNNNNKTQNDVDKNGNAPLTSNNTSTNSNLIHVEDYFYDNKENVSDNVGYTVDPDYAVHTVQFSSAVTFDLCSQSSEFSEDEPCSIDIPKPWSVLKSQTGKEESLLFVCFVNKENVKTHTFEKVVVMSKNRELQYEVHSNTVNAEMFELPKKVDNVKNLPQILQGFKKFCACEGININDVDCTSNLLNCNNYNLSGCRSKNCSLLSLNYSKCRDCKKLSKLLSQQKRRLKKLSNNEEIKKLKPSSQIKLKALQRKNQRRRKELIRLKYRLHVLEKSLEKNQCNIANINENDFDKNSSSLNMSQNQKMIVKEIIRAAKYTNPKGRRYSDDFIMLCLLMNIRSPSFYEFLRKNDILPLPCSKTVRDYLSMIRTKCGFDDGFFKLLEKSFKGKDPMKRHGILILDEIHLRKSISVSSKDLTYSGLTDFGENNKKGENLDAVATHGLVLMFQSLTEKYSQPIAVFASKNSVHGNELAKLVVQSIYYLENCGAKIHGILGDGASTNDKMWKLLNIKSSREDTKCWFTHPCDENRKVFMFSDAPHLIKCIRNRLYSNNLRIHPDENEIKWDYFLHLFHVDSNHEARVRACPKLTKRHIKLDPQGLMRVRYATQIFSDSVAKGLIFYQMHQYPQFEGCEDTANFCMKMNEMFDALNRHQPNQGLTPNSKDFKVLQNILLWLNNWEINLENGLIDESNYLTLETAGRLRVTIMSTLTMCHYLIDKFDFSYLLTGKVNQDNLEKFFGTIRLAAGSNEHPTCPTFLQLYKLLAAYSILKPPRYGNCLVTEQKVQNLITISEIKEIFEKSHSKSTSLLNSIKNKLDSLIEEDTWEVDEVIEHDYSIRPVIDCIIYYTTAYWSKKGIGLHFTAT
ncbi:uncharacterized protein LOC127285741 [Leptopilina boulardi]|nr:uncharacterized protein LOC127280586 [Leptopilina boulardi]XP_051167842.1 uncharacterized protein LOC127285741 [Leptopilina boulardi]